MSKEELLQSFERQVKFIREQLIIGEYKNAVNSTELLATYLSIKFGEIGKEGE